MKKKNKHLIIVKELSTLAKKCSAAARKLQSSSYELSTLVSGKV